MGSRAVDRVAGVAAVAAEAGNKNIFMQITKFGHSCILLDDGTAKVLFDPGSWSEVPEISVDAIIITHVHPDHLSGETIQKLQKVNPQLRIITNGEVVAELAKLQIEAEIVEQGKSTTVQTFQVQAFGNQHAIIHPELPVFQNTGYLINGTILHPGDALLEINQPVHVLLLPVAAPWSKVAETLDYISATRAHTYVPIHDGFLKVPGLFYRMAKQWAEKNNGIFIEPELGKQYEI